MGIVQEIEFWPYYQIVYAQTRIHPRDALNSQGFWEVGRPHNSCHKPDNLDYSTVELGQNTQKNPGNLRRFTLTQTPVKEPQLILGWKTCKEYNKNAK